MAPSPYAAHSAISPKSPTTRLVRHALRQAETGPAAGAGRSPGVRWVPGGGRSPVAGRIAGTGLAGGGDAARLAGGGGGAGAGPADVAMGCRSRVRPVTT